MAIIDPVDRSVREYKELLKTLELLTDEGSLKNNRELVVYSGWSLDPWFLRINCSMPNLEKLDVMEYDVKFSDLACLFQSCPKLLELRMKLSQSETSEIDENCRNNFRLGFQRLQCFELGCYVFNSWKFIQEVLP